MTKDIRIGPSFKIYDDNRYYSAFPTAARLCNGRLLVLFRRARDHRWLLSGDGGISDADLHAIDHVDSRSHIAAVEVDPQTGSAGEVRALPSDPQAADQDPSLLALRSGRLLLGGFAWYPVAAERAGALRALGIGMLDAEGKKGGPFIFWGGNTRLSQNGGYDWSDHTSLPPLPGFPDLVPGRRPFFGGAVRGRAVEQADGTVLQAAYALHPGTSRYVSLLHASTDGGTHWSYRSAIAADPEGDAGFVEPMLLDSGDGRLLALHRTTGLDDRLAIAASRDGGWHWDPWTVHGVVGHPFDACTLPDGRVLLAYGYRHPPYGVRLRVWDPCHQEPQDAEEFIVRDDAPSPDVGYPWVCPVNDTRAVIVYYIADTQGIRHIAANTLDIG